ncbi:prepilin peptidase [Breoghania sp. L-A4]|uniref:A24 family peptidase n=1 Tax=Breoghania sp. L-A4 TaxID=2304600 RepID=UPI000E35A90B|nr:prepilin peptidase [Breoghania sp. L-A4]AXS38891.1 peptidase [Breoghania sp. L-A4]
MLQTAAFAVFPVIVTLAAVSDLMTMTISNRFSIALIIGFAVLAPWLPGMNLPLAGMHLAAAALVLTVTFSLFAFGIIGGGDAKLAAVIALWLGWGPLFAFAVYTTMIGAALCIALLAFRSIPIPIIAMRQDWIMRLHDRKEGAPYGIALAASAMLVYPDSLWSVLLG